LEFDPLSDPAPRLAPRSAGAIADVALLRAARTEVGERESPARLTLGERVRGLAPLRAVRQAAGDTVSAVRADRRDA
jgi:hypothetical protein